MNKLEIFKELEKLDLPKDKYIVINGASLVSQDIIEETDDIDLAISEIMTFMEKSFHIPMFEKDVPLWIMKNEKRNKFILHILYNKITFISS